MLPAPRRGVEGSGTSRHGGCFSPCCPAPRASLLTKSTRILASHFPCGSCPWCPPCQPLYKSGLAFSVPHLPLHQQFLLSQMRGFPARWLADGSTPGCTIELCWPCCTGRCYAKTSQICIHMHTFMHKHMHAYTRKCIHTCEHAHTQSPAGQLPECSGGLSGTRTAGNPVALGARS